MHKSKRNQTTKQIPLKQTINCKHTNINIQTNLYTINQPKSITTKNNHKQQIKDHTTTHFRTPKTTHKFQKANKKQVNKQSTKPRSKITTAKANKAQQTTNNPNRQHPSNKNKTHTPSNNPTQICPTKSLQP